MTLEKNLVDILLFIFKKNIFSYPNTFRNLNVSLSDTRFFWQKCFFPPMGLSCVPPPRARWQTAPSFGPMGLLLGGGGDASSLLFLDQSIPFSADGASPTQPALYTLKPSIFFYWIIVLAPHTSDEKFKIIYLLLTYLYHYSIDMWLSAAQWINKTLISLSLLVWSQHDYILGHEKSRQKNFLKLIVV